jgi:hypothetical protein
MGCEYMLECQGLIKQFVNSYVLLPLFHNESNKKKPLIIYMFFHAYKTCKKQCGEWNQ